MTLLTEKQASELMGLSIQTLAIYRKNGSGPASVRLTDSVRSRIRYEEKAINRWIAQRSRIATGTGGYWRWTPE